MQCMFSFQRSIKLKCIWTSSDFDSNTRRKMILGIKQKCCSSIKVRQTVFFSLAFSITLNYVANKKVAFEYKYNQIKFD